MIGVSSVMGLTTQDTIDSCDLMPSCSVAVEVMLRAEVAREGSMKPLRRDLR